MLILLVQRLDSELLKYTELELECLNILLCLTLHSMNEVHFHGKFVSCI